MNMNMKLPFLISVPHAGLTVPSEVKKICQLTKEEIIEDGDKGAADIYYPLKNNVKEFVTTDVARAIVDMNRAEDDIRKDGVIKTHTCWDVPVYRTFPSADKMEILFEKYYRPYHAKLRKISQEVMLGIDCHTMSAVGPPVGPDADMRRPLICISNADGTCSQELMKSLTSCFEEFFKVKVSVNYPFTGGYIIKSHSHEIPWVQLEFSRADFMSNKEKSSRLLKVLKTWFKMNARIIV